MRIITGDADIAEGLEWLGRTDHRLRPIIAAVGPVSSRRRDAGLAGLVRVIIGQQVSTASADAIWLRFASIAPVLTAEAIATMDDETLRQAGLSRAKMRTMRALVDALDEGLNLADLASLPADTVRARLTAVKGIGPWTADLYLLFCLGHADVFPAGDLALRLAVHEGLGLEVLLSERDLADTATVWAPWRGVAAHLFWAFYRWRRLQNPQRK